MKRSLPLLFLLLASLVQLSCFFSTTSTEKVSVEKKDMQTRKEINVPTKIHLLDASVIEVDSGFSLINDTLLAVGARTQVASETGVFGYWRIPLDSVVGVEYFSKKTNGLAIVGNIVLTTVVAAVGIVLVKAIFGSCPTVYAVTNNKEVLQSECFSYCIGRQFERGDLDRLKVSTSDDVKLRLRIRNEALETHYINKLALCVVRHSRNAEAFPTSEGKVVVVEHLLKPVSALDSKGKSILGLVAEPEGNVYQTDSASTYTMLKENRFDRIDLKVPRPSRAKTMSMVFRVRNTLEGTVLFYDVMLRDQGALAVQWTEALSKDPVYSWRVGQYYKEFSGLRISMDDGGVVSETKVYDTGPLAWKDVAAYFDLKGNSDTVNVSVSMMPDYWMIDRIGFSFESTTPSWPQLIEPSSVYSSSDVRLPIVEKALAETDDDYAVTYPGDRFDIEFKAEQETEMSQTFFLYSQGYYIEWIRGAWLRDDHSLRAFDPSESKESRQRLADLWLAKKKSFEKEFFERRAN